MDLTSIKKLQCPRCGHNRNIRVEISARAVLDNMAVYEYSCITTSLYNEAKCNSCNHVGTVEEFYEAAAQAPSSDSVMGDALRRL